MELEQQLTAKLCAAVCEYGFTNVFVIPAVTGLTMAFVAGRKKNSSSGSFVEIAAVTLVLLTMVVFSTVKEGVRKLWNRK